jgi:hypothetical protein
MLKNLANKPAVKLAAIITANIAVVVATQLIAKKIVDTIEA